MKNIVLTGFMGTGKSSVGRRLAKELNLKFIDTDDLIEKEAGIDINEIFTKFGEGYFRLLESKVVHEISSNTNMVIATGGGTIVNPLNFEILKRNGTIICLTASIDAIFSRIGKGDERPLISKDDKREAISDLLKAREPFYKKTDFIIDTTAKTIGEVVKEIKEKILAMGDRL
ncbi:MAG: shikimate kinase [Deltaproteobacteria bacterium]|nr:shikimate kinase [Deltaproteobacteria bacterium]